MEKERLHYLFNQYIHQYSTPAEEEELMQQLAEPLFEEGRRKLVDECFDNLPEKYILDEKESDRIFRQITGRQGRTLNTTLLKRKGVIRWLRLVAAVAAVLVIVAGIGMFRKVQPLKQETQVIELVKPFIKPLYKNDVTPGGNKACLTLADGTKIDLDNVSNGTLTRQGNTRIIKLENGRLTYSPQSAANKLLKTVLYNTLTTPRGGQYCITLPDGSTVWLNASTSLKFPATFTGKERIVEVKGEAYFEVAKNSAMPFTVKAGSSEIKVLGTHFNVMAYEDEKTVKTTVLEGSVDVTVARHSSVANEQPKVTLQPGQQAQLDRNNQIKVVDVDLEETIAWKNGYFIFNNENIESIMSKISRWYDVKVVFMVSPANKDFTGNISRSQNVSEVLNMLELTDIIHFKIEGEVITVLP